MLRYVDIHSIDGRISVDERPLTMRRSISLLLASLAALALLGSTVSASANAGHRPSDQPRSPADSRGHRQVPQHRHRPGRRLRALRRYQRRLVHCRAGHGWHGGPLRQSGADPGSGDQPETSQKRSCTHPTATAPYGSRPWSTSWTRLAWTSTHSTPPSLFPGHPFDETDAPNRYGLADFYSQHVWAWKRNPPGRSPCGTPTSTADT